MNSFTLYSCLRQSISDSEVQEILENQLDLLRSRLTEQINSFVNAPIRPLAMFEFERGLFVIVREFLGK